jgi:hypothetical protein
MRSFRILCERKRSECCPSTYAHIAWSFRRFAATAFAVWPIGPIPSGCSSLYSDSVASGVSLTVTSLRTNGDRYPLRPQPEAAPEYYCNDIGPIDVIQNCCECAFDVCRADVTAEVSETICDLRGCRVGQPVVLGDIYRCTECDSSLNHQSSP